MKYILDGNAQTITLPESLTFTVTDVVLPTGGSASFEDTNGNTFTVPGSGALPFSIFTDVEITGDAETVVTMVLSNGGQTDAAAFDGPTNAGHYPGKWGTGIGSKTRGPF